MSDLKRRRDSRDSEAASEVERLSKQNHGNRTADICALRETTRLSDLPGELLTEIFFLAGNPSLIHVFRNSWYNLPDFKSYTSALIALAYGDRQIKLSEALVSQGLKPLLGWTHHQRDELQAEIANCHWLQPVYLEKTYLKL